MVFSDILVFGGAFSNLYFLFSTFLIETFIYGVLYSGHTIYCGIWTPLSRHLHNIKYFGLIFLVMNSFRLHKFVNCSMRILHKLIFLSDSCSTV